MRIFLDVGAKLNVEGAEAEILEDLIATGEIKKLSALLVDLDIRKVPMERPSTEQILSDLDQAGVRYTVGNPSSGPSHVARVQTWLERAGASSRPMTAGDRARSAGIRLRYVAIPSASRALRLGKLVQRVFGKRAHLLIRSRVLGYRFEDRKIRPKHN